MLFGVLLFKPTSSAALSLILKCKQFTDYDMNMHVCKQVTKLGFSVSRSAVRLSHKWHREERNASQTAEQEPEVSDRHDYYNVVPGMTPPAGGLEQLQITREENKQDVSTQKVGHKQYSVG